MVRKKQRDVSISPALYVGPSPAQLQPFGEYLFDDVIKMQTFTAIYQ
jgi:hypothetical protein